MSSPLAWRLELIERTVHETKNRVHEIDALRSEVGHLEDTLREVRAEIVGVRRELQSDQERLMQLEARMNDRL